MAETAPQTQGEAGTSSNTPTMMYPSDIQTYSHFISINSFSYSRQNRSSETARKSAYKGHVILPVPSNLQVGYASEYSGMPLGWDGEAKIDLAQGAFQTAQAARSMRGVSAQVDVINNSINAGLSAVADQFPGAASATVLDKFPDIGGAAFGVAVNPHLAVLFQGVDFRQHTFQYEMVARNEQESNAIRDIIRFFKSSMAPSFADGMANHIFKYPDEFDIQLSDTSYFFQFAPCVLRGFDVVYHTDTPLYFAKTKAPVHVGIRLNFMETQIITREDIEQGGK